MYLRVLPIPTHTHTHKQLYRYHLGKVVLRKGYY